MELVKAVLEGMVGIEIIKWDMGKLKKIAETGVALPGVHVKKEIDTHTRG
jgi:hypothetical protein